MGRADQRATYYPSCVALYQPDSTIFGLCLMSRRPGYRVAPFTRVAVFRYARLALLRNDTDFSRRESLLESVRRLIVLLQWPMMGARRVEDGSCLQHYIAIFSCRIASS